MINNLIKPYDKNDKQHIIDKAQGMIDIIIINKGDISIKVLLLLSEQLFGDILSSMISVMFI